MELDLIENDGSMITPEQEKSLPREQQLKRYIATIRRVTKSSGLIQYGKDIKFRPDFCDQLVAHMTGGYSYESFGAIVGATPSEIKKWEKHKAWNSAKEIGIRNSLLFWESVLRDAVEGKIKTQAQLIIFKLKNAFSDIYQDKQVQEHTGGYIIKINTGIKRPGDEGFVELKQDPKVARKTVEATCKVVPEEPDIDSTKLNEKVPITQQFKEEDALDFIDKAVKGFDLL